MTMAVELPDELTLSGLTYAIERVKDLKHNDGEKCNGLCDTDEQTVSIDSGIRGHESKRITLLHEISHLIEHHAGLSLKESQIDAVGRSVYSLIVDNPDLMAWITDPKPTRKKPDGQSQQPQDPTSAS